MDLHHFFTASRVLVVAGKGGVGKTTVSAVLARAAAKVGLRVLVVDLDAKPALAEMLGGTGPLPYEPVELGAGAPGGAGRMTGRTLDPSQALAEYLDDRGLRRVSRRLATSGIIDMVSTAAPGIDDILVLGKLKQLERHASDVDLIVVDGPAAGHAITFLRSARSLGDAVRSGPIATQAADVLDLLADPTRCQVMLVTLPETTPVNELVETAYALEEDVGVHLAPIVVNGIDPLTHDPQRLGALAGHGAKPDDNGPNDNGPDDNGTRVALSAAAEFRLSRCLAQIDEIARLADELALPQIRLPWLPTAGLSPRDVETLADELIAQVQGFATP